MAAASVYLFIEKSILTILKQNFIISKISREYNMLTTDENKSKGAYYYE